MTYSPRFAAFVPFIFREECDWPNDKSGQYSNDPDDPGGATKFGIDQRSNPGVAIKSLTYDQADDIYWRQYWQGRGAESHPYPLGEVYMNSCVNGGHPDEWVKLGDAAKFVDAQEQYYRDLCAYWSRRGKHDPYKYLPDWLGRCARLRAWVKLLRRGRGTMPRRGCRTLFSTRKILSCA